VLPDSSTLALFVAAAVALVLVPGPAVLYIVAQSIDQGRIAGLVSALGIGAGGLVHVAAATLGLSSLLVSSATAFTVVKYAGAAYLVFLGLRRLFASDKADVHLRRQKTRRRLFSQGIVVNVLNPKAALFFFFAFLPQFVDVPRGSVALQIATLGIVFVAIALASDGLYALLAGTLAGWVRGKARFLKAQRYVSGTVLVGLGVATALSGPSRARSTFPQALRG
jgi:threonine/homoserine/homoserine lactone efflux protein